MGAVGINFGSVTSGSGFDVTTTVASIVANLQQVETPWNNQLTSLKADDTALTSIGTDLSSLGTSLQALTDFEGVMTEKEGSSSDTDILTLSSASATATAGSHTVVVSQLAQTASDYSDPIASTDTISGALTIKVGTGPATTIPVVSGTSDTMTTLCRRHQSRRNRSYRQRHLRHLGFAAVAGQRHQRRKRCAKRYPGRHDCRHYGADRRRSQRCAHRNRPRDQHIHSSLFHQRNLRSLQLRGRVG